MNLINIYKAKTNLSKLVKRVSAGEEIVIGKAGEPLVKMIKYEQHQSPRTPGSWKGKVHIKPDFDVLPEDILDAFSGMKS